MSHGVVYTYWFGNRHRFQIVFGQMINKNGAERITHHIDCGTESISVMRKQRQGVKQMEMKSMMTYTYKSQSTAIMRVMSLDGKPTVSKTMTIVTKPACGIPAAPIEAAVAVTLFRQ